MLIIATCHLVPVCDTNHCEFHYTGCSHKSAIRNSISETKASFRFEKKKEKTVYVLFSLPTLSLENI